MPTFAEMEAPKFALIAFETSFKNARIEAVGSEARMLEMHAGTEYGTGTFYSVRLLAHKMAQDAAAQMAASLTERQRRALRDLEADRRRVGRSEVRPGYESGRSWEPRAWRGMDSYSLNTVTNSQKFAGLLRKRGVAYGPKTYKLTELGRAVASSIINAES